MAKSKDKKKSNEDPNARTVTRNRRARHEYDILDEFECGIVLRGTEVKSVRNNKISIEEAYARVKDGEVWLIGADIAEYPQASYLNHDPQRQRKLLLKKSEIRQCEAALTQQGLTLIPLAIYFQRGIIKLQLGIAKGRKLHDKRDKLRKQDDDKAIRAAKLHFK